MKFDARIVLGAIGLLGIGLVPSTPIAWSIIEFAPLSLVTYAPILFVGTKGLLSEKNGIIVGAIIGASVAPIVFIYLCRSILKGKQFPGWPTLAIFVIATILSLGLAALWWSATVRYTSLSRAVALLVQSVVPPLLVVGVYLMSRKPLTRGRMIAICWCALAWFTWAAFPWWGELP
jgi:hypothetical protein